MAATALPKTARVIEASVVIASASSVAASVSRLRQASAVICSRSRVTAETAGQATVAVDLAGPIIVETVDDHRIEIDWLPGGIRAPPSTHVSAML